MTKPKTKKLRRYHRDIYFPDWANFSLKEFAQHVRVHGSVTFSLHAVEKSLEYGFDYGRKFLKFISKIIRQDVLKVENVFEFYAEGGAVRKACFRVSSPEILVDLVLVISSDGVVVTIFVINKGDNHNTLDEKVYERKP